MEKFIEENGTVSHMSPLRLAKAKKGVERLREAKATIFSSTKERFSDDFL
jgi:hypothetical protein